MITEDTSRVIEKKQLNETVWEVALKLDKPTEWVAGQYVSLSEVRRSYSIASLPEDKEKISLCIDTKPNGPGSLYIKNLKTGDEVRFLGPLGKFILEPGHQPPATNYVFVAMGTGIAPFKAMIPTLLNQIKNPISNSNDQYPISNVQLFWGLRHKGEIYYQDFFEDLKRKFPNFSYQIVLSEEGHHVTEYTANLKGEFYLCGNMGMVADVLGLHPEAHYESYY